MVRVSDVTSESQEGLPCQCFKAIARFEGRVAWWFDPDPRCLCGGYQGSYATSSKHHHIKAGVEISEINGSPACWADTGVPWTHTDDADEAQAAFKGAAEYVRTGEIA